MGTEINGLGYVHIQGVSKPMSQTVSGYSPPPINPLNAELNLICHLLALLEAHHILHVSRIRVKQKSSYQHGSKSEQVPSYRLTFMCWYPFEYYIRFCLNFRAS